METKKKKKPEQSLKVENFSIEALKPYPNNPRKNDAAIEAVARSIQEFGWRAPIVVDKDHVIICGHTRYKAAQHLGLKEVPVHVADNLTPEQIQAYRIADNKTGDIAEWDMDLLSIELGALMESEYDASLSGFTLEEIGDLLAEDTEEDAPIEGLTDKEAIPEAPEAPVSVPGTLYALGPHRLLCGDSTRADDVAKVMAGEKADLVFTDPPYGMKKEAEGVLNDNLNYDDLLEFNKQWIPHTFTHSKDNGSWYCWGIDEPLMDIYSEILKPMIRKKEITFRNLLTWDKGSAQGQKDPGHRMYVRADEKCLFVMIGGESVQGFCVNADDYNPAMDKVRLYLHEEIKRLNLSDTQIANALGYSSGRTVGHWHEKSQFALPTRENYEALRAYGRQVLASSDLLKREYDDLKREYDDLKREYDDLKRDFYAGRSFFDNVHDNMNDVWHFPPTSQKEREGCGGHATPKPIDLCSRAIKSSSRKGETVLDVFGGSGSTLIACERLGRKARLIELDPKYCDVIRKRYAEYVHGPGCEWESLTPELKEPENETPPKTNP